MGGHFLAALALFGTIRYPVLLCGYANRGRELEAAKQLILAVAHLRETFSTQPVGPHPEAWIVIPDMSFSPAELREAAYARWSIENDVFKKLSPLAGTKRFHLKDPSTFLSVIRILCAAVTAFELVILSLNASKELFKAFRDGIKPTVCGLFSRLVDFLENSLFA